MKLEPFDPTDDFEAMADAFRQQTAEMALKALDNSIYNKLDGHRQIECFVAGVITGLVGVCLAQAAQKNHGDVMDFIESYLPQARQQAEGILSGPRTN